jgi:hypothetical protein
MAAECSCIVRPVRHEHLGRFSMNWRRTGALLGALMMVGAFATDAFAQRFDREERRRFREREWVLLGEKSVGFLVDRDVIRVGRDEDWFRSRSFRTLHFSADQNDIFMISARVVYLNGFEENFRIEQRIEDGEDLSIDLRGERSFIRRIEMVYRSRPSFRGQAVIRVYGEPFRRGRGPGPDADAGRWTELGCQRVSLFGKDRDSIRVGRREGRFKAIRLYVRGADVEILDLRVIYANGEPDDIRVRHFLRQGDRTQRLDLRGRERSIDRVDMVYRTIPNFKGLATVCVEGLD